MILRISCVQCTWVRGEKDSLPIFLVETKANPMYAFHIKETVTRVSPQPKLYIIHSCKCYFSFLGVNLPFCCPQFLGSALDNNQQQMRITLQNRKTTLEIRPCSTIGPSKVCACKYVCVIPLGEGKCVRTALYCLAVIFFESQKIVLVQG